MNSPTPVAENRRRYEPPKVLASYKKDELETALWPEGGPGGGCGCGS